MLRSIKQLYGEKLGASDGDIGHVKDFYFDDQKWAVRYVIVDTGSWISGRLVLLAPHAFGSLHQDGRVLLVNLTRQQIENSPSIETHKPVSRQYEEEYYRYYGWPSYWDGDGMWGMSAFPVTPTPACAFPVIPPPARAFPVIPPPGYAFPVIPLAAYPLPSKQATEGGGPHHGDDPHLRSTQAVGGYHIQTSDGMIGHVADLIMDDQSWAIRHLVVETGHWFSGKEIVISPNHIDWISYAESKVLVNLTKEAILQAHRNTTFLRSARQITISRK